MNLFSERYNYRKATDVVIRASMTQEIQNAICSCFDRLADFLLDNRDYSERRDAYTQFEKYLWCNFLNQRENNFYDEFGYNKIVATRFIEDKNKQWFEKLDLVEFAIKFLVRADEFLRKNSRINKSSEYVSEFFIHQINKEFKRLNYAYRVVNSEIIEITDEREIKEIETAISNSKYSIREHLNKALEYYAMRPQPDFRNSIKESISAVEALCRKHTGKKSLGDAINELKNKQKGIPSLFLDSLNKLYGYTNSRESGIRHALMSEESDAGNEEALFMLITCSAFINYLRGKLGN